MENPRDSDVTVVRCVGFDHFGGLANLTTALSTYDLDIKAAFIRPENEASDVPDIFHVVSNANGSRLTDEELEGLASHMRRSLSVDDVQVLDASYSSAHGGVEYAVHARDEEEGTSGTYFDAEGARAMAESWHVVDTRDDDDDTRHELGRSSIPVVSSDDIPSYSFFNDDNGDFGGPAATEGGFEVSYRGQEPEPQQTRSTSSWDDPGSWGGGAATTSDRDEHPDLSWHGGSYDDPAASLDEDGLSAAAASWNGTTVTDNGGTTYWTPPNEDAATTGAAREDLSWNASWGGGGGGDHDDVDASLDEDGLSSAANAWNHQLDSSPPAVSHEPRRDQDFSWNAPSAPAPEESTYSTPTPYGAQSVDGANGSAIPADPASVLSAQLRVAAAEMAAAAAHFVALERQRAAATNPAEMDRLQAPRMEAQAALESRMTAMRGMLAERDAMRNRALGITTEDELDALASPPSFDWSPAPAATPRPYESPAAVIARPYEAPLPMPDAIKMPTFEPPALKERKEEKKKKEEKKTEALPPPPPPLDVPIPAPVTPMGTGDEVMLQGFNWESCKPGNWFNMLSGEARAIKDAGFSSVWLPPPTKSVSDQGYLPSDLYDLNSFYGSQGDLQRCIAELKNHGICPVADIVINHRCAEAKDDAGRWNIFTGRMAWDQRAVTTDNPEFGGQGHAGTGENYGPAPNIDHTQDWVRNDLKEWLRWMRDDIGFGGWRFDFVKGYAGNFTGEYVADSAPRVSVGEHWVACNYNGGDLEYDQNSHRQSTYDWCDSTGGNTAAFDFTTKGILQEAVRNKQYWRMIDHDGHPTGFLGKWPTHAVTFLENHDTGSTLQHWPFPTDKLQEGYAYILTHPGTPTVFYDHWKDGGLRDMIEELIATRRENEINCNAAVHIERAEDGCYAAHIGSPRQHVERGLCDEVDMSRRSICMKLGPGDWSPNHTNVGNTKWKLRASGDGWAVWENEQFL